MVLIVCDGDSVTAGVGGVAPYPTMIAADCNALVGVTPTVTNKGVSAQNSYQMLWGATGSPTAPGADGLAAEVLSLHPDIVTLCVGLNDVTWLAAGNSDAALVSVWRAYIDKVLATAAPNGSPTPIVAIYENFCFQTVGTYIRPAVAQDHCHTLWRQTLQEYANNPFVTVIDVYPFFRRYGVDTVALSQALQADRGHPNAGGYGAFRYPLQYALATLTYAAQAGAYDGTVPNPAPLRPTAMTVRASALRAALGEYDRDDGSNLSVQIPAAF